MNDLETPPLSDLLQASHSYIDRYKDALDQIQPNLWMDLMSVPQLSPTLQKDAINYFLELACQSQNALNINLGRASLLTIPKNWLVSNIEAQAILILKSGGSWEFRRLLEMYLKLDKSLVQNLIDWGQQQSNAEIHQIIEELK